MMKNEKEVKIGCRVQKENLSENPLLESESSSRLFPKSPPNKIGV